MSDRYNDRKSEVSNPYAHPSLKRINSDEETARLISLKKEQAAQAKRNTPSVDIGDYVELLKQKHASVFSKLKSAFHDEITKGQFDGDLFYELELIYQEHYPDHPLISRLNAFSSLRKYFSNLNKNS